MPIDPVILKAELIVDPKNMVFNPLDPFGDAAKLNDRGLSGETIELEEVPVLTAQAAVVISEYAALSADMQRAWSTLISACGAPRADGTTGFPVKNLLIRAQVLEIWVGGTTTRLNLGALQNRSASRAEVLGGEDVTVSAPDITHARGLI